jgi:hypothetical protein
MASKETETGEGDAQVLEDLKTKRAMLLTVRMCKLFIFIDLRLSSNIRPFEKKIFF